MFGEYFHYDISVGASLSVVSDLCCSARRGVSSFLICSPGTSARGLFLPDAMVVSRRTRVSKFMIFCTFKRPSCLVIFLLLEHGLTACCLSLSLRACHTRCC